VPFSTWSKPNSGPAVSPAARRARRAGGVRRARMSVRARRS